MRKRSCLQRWGVFSAALALSLACGGADYRYPAELPVKSLHIEMEERGYGAGMVHMGTMHVHRLTEKMITRDSRPFSSILLHVRAPDGSDIPVRAVPTTWDRTKKLETEVVAVCLRWSPDVPEAQAGESYPCYISYEEEGQKPWATREFSLRFGGSGKHMKCARCFSIGMAPKVTLTQTTGRRMENLMGGTNTTFERGSMERNVARRMESFDGKTNTAVRFNTLEQTATNRMATQLAGGFHEGTAGSLEQSATDRMNVLRGEGRQTGKAGSLERSAYDRTQAAMSSNARQRQTHLLAQGITVYDLSALPRARPILQLPAGTAVQLLSEITPALVHVRFPLPDGGFDEGVARYAELGVKRMAGMRKTVKLPEGQRLTLVWCPPGRFMMGSPLWEPFRNGDETQHGVVLTRGFWMGQFEVTHEQWESVMDPKESSYGRSPEKGLPVTDVTWNECQMFCRRLREATGLPFRLPTEAEWEYACRAGNPGTCAGTGYFEEMAWSLENSNDEMLFTPGKIHPVGLKKANDWGLHDMQGNAAEWCADGYAAYPRAVATDPRGNPDSRGRVVRGGNYTETTNDIRVARRIASLPGMTNPQRGFRVVVAEGESPDATSAGSNASPSPAGQDDALLERAMVRESAARALAEEESSVNGDDIRPGKVELTRNTMVYSLHGAPGEYPMGTLKAGTTLYVMEDLGRGYARIRFTGSGGRSVERAIQTRELRGSLP